MKVRGKIKAFIPTEKQREFLENDAKWRAFIGGVGCGKTTAGCMEAIRCAVQYVGSRGLIARKTWKELIHTTMDVFWNLVPFELVLRHSVDDGMIILKAVDMESGEVGESVIFYRPLDRREKIEGLNLSWFYVDEASEIDEEMFSALQGRVRSPVGPRRGWITTTPPSVSHWIYKKFIQEKNPAYAAIFASTFDNPYLPEDYISYLKTSLSGEYYRRMVLGEFGHEREGAPVFINFSPEIHIVKEEEVKELLKQAGVLYRGIDFGYWHPAAVWGILDAWGRLVIVDEYIGEQMTIDMFAEVLKRIDAEKWATLNKRVLVDFHDPHSVYTTDMVIVDRHMILREKGFNPVPAPIGGSVEYGINVIMRLMDSLIMGKPLLRVSEKCRMLIEGFQGGYCWDARGKLPIQNIYAHIFDALRYLVLGIKHKVGPKTTVLPTEVASHKRSYFFSYTEDYSIEK